MDHKGRALALAVAGCVFLSAGTAYAAPGVDTVQDGVAVVAGVVALLLAVGLLVAVLALRRVASGGAIAENISYVVLGVVCLSAAVLAGWVSRFLPESFSAEQARLGSDLLVTVSIAFFLIYFNAVRDVMARFVRYATSVPHEPLVSEEITTVSPAPEAEDAGSPASTQQEAGSSPQSEHDPAQLEFGEEEQVV